MTLAELLREAAAHFGGCKSGMFYGGPSAVDTAECVHCRSNGCFDDRSFKHLDGRVIFHVDPMMIVLEDHLNDASGS